MVVFIVGLSASIVVMTLPARSDVLREETVRLERVIDTLADRAVLANRTYGLELTATGYRGVVFQNNDWAPFTEYDRDLPTAVTLQTEALNRNADQPARLIFPSAGVPSVAEIELVQGVDRLDVTTPYTDQRERL